jgi:hypothetical protein
MGWFARLIAEGGVTMLWIKYLIVPGLLVVAVHVFAPRRWSLWCSALVIALIVGAGAYGTLEQRSRIGDPLPTPVASERELEQLRAEGYREANRPIQFGGVVAGGLAVILSIAELRRRVRRIPAAIPPAARS